jgi:hypothetical protein
MPAFVTKPGSGAPPMLDVVFILIAAVFLGGCALYAHACDRL